MANEQYQIHLQATSLSYEVSRRDTITPVTNAVLYAYYVVIVRLGTLGITNILALSPAQLNLVTSAEEANICNSLLGSRSCQLWLWPRMTTLRNTSRSVAVVMKDSWCMQRFGTVEGEQGETLLSLTVFFVVVNVALNMKVSSIAGK